MRTTRLRGKPLALCALACALLLGSCGGGSNTSSAQPPNILFIVLDDLGVDQLQAFGYGGATAPHTPTLDAIAAAGVRFRNAWSMPTCTPTRATFFSGRYPSRTNVLNAVVALDLANSQVSPFELTTPKLLRTRGYVNALVGKMHLSGSDLNPANHPFGNQVMWKLGWDHFEGYLDGGPYPVDTTAGGVAAAGTYPCGFVPTTRDDAANGADNGACYLPDGACTPLSTADAPTPGRACLERGGIFDPRKACQASRPAYLDFDTQNAYYTGEWVVSRADGSNETLRASDPAARGYRTTLETDRAIRWAKQQPSTRPWMLSVGYSANHTPLQPPPASLLPAGALDTSGFTCGASAADTIADLRPIPARMATALTQARDIAQTRVVSNQMIEAMDSEIGRMLVELGLAKRLGDGTLDYHPEQTNTVVIVMGDNGSYAPSVKAPFDLTRAKGFPYQTGVWVPLIIAGPMVKQPDREVPHMVNSADLYSLFGEIAGINVRSEVPASRTLDAQPLLPYLTEPQHAAIRSTNFTEMGTNITSTREAAAPPCVIPASNICVQIFPQQGVCEDQGGTWYGAGGAAGATGLASCCAVNDYLQSNGQAAVDILPDSQRALRNAGFKLVQINRMNCSSGRIETTDEFYQVDERTPVPLLDTADRNLMPPSNMTAQQRQNYDSLKAQLGELLAANVDCPGDGNLDKVVDAEDLRNWQEFSTLNGGRSSWYDFNHDGLTDAADRAIIQANMGKRCGT